MARAGGNTLRVRDMTRLILLSMVPLFACGKTQGMLGREGADGRGFLRNGSGRNLQSGSVCGVDFPGIRSSGGTGKICCVAECGECGGDGCSSVGSSHGLGKEHCCASGITEQGDMCSDTMAAPCVIESGDTQPTPAPTPEPEPEATMNYEFVRCSAVTTEDTGETAFDLTFEDSNLTLSTCYEHCAKQFALYFAVLEGDECACGMSAEFLDANDKPLGDCDMACPGNSAETCGGTSSYDLYKIPLPTCSSGIVGVESESGDVCCGYRCGTCGGDRCVGWGDCCEETIQVREGMCSDTNEAPCIYNKVHVDTPPPAPLPDASPREERLCSNGMPGVESADGATCCWDGCIECNGMGEECVGVTNCCEQAIHESDVYCSDDGVEEGPCIM